MSSRCSNNNNSNNNNDVLASQYFPANEYIENVNKQNNLIGSSNINNNNNNLESRAEINESVTESVRSE